MSWTVNGYQCNLISPSFSISRLALRSLCEGCSFITVTTTIDSLILFVKRIELVAIYNQGTFLHRM